MKGQLFEIETTHTETLFLLWCSDEYIMSEEIKIALEKIWKTVDDDYDYEEIVEKLNNQFSDQGITFERVYTEEIII